MDFTMDLPDVDKVKEEVKTDLEPTKEVQTQIQTVASNNIDQLVNIDLNSLEQRREVVSTIDGFGKDLITKSSNKNQLLETRLVDLSKTGSESGTVVKGLSELQIQMKDLDPSGIDFMKQGALGKIFNPVRNYFAKYERADKVIADIVVSLGKGKATLKNDNVTLEIEQTELRGITQKLNQQVALGTQMDESISAAIEKAKTDGTDPEKIKFIEEEVLFPLRQRILDMQQMQTVDMQGVVAMEVIRRNNKELIRAVERAETVTVSALKVAVTVASALYNQKIVLEKVTAVNQATNSLIQSTSKMLKEQGAEIQQKAMEANISVDTLRQAFTDTFDALDQVSQYKENALPQMKTTINEFKALAEEGEGRIKKLEQREQLMAENNTENN